MEDLLDTQTAVHLHEFLEAWGESVNLHFSQTPGDADTAGPRDHTWRAPESKRKV